MPCDLRLTYHPNQPQLIVRFSLQSLNGRLYKPENPINNDHEVVPESSAPQIKAPMDSSLRVTLNSKRQK